MFKYQNMLKYQLSKIKNNTRQFILLYILNHLLTTDSKCFIFQLIEKIYLKTSNKIIPWRKKIIKQQARSLGKVIKYKHHFVAQRYQVSLNSKKSDQCCHPACYASIEKILFCPFCKLNLEAIL